MPDKPGRAGEGITASKKVSNRPECLSVIPEAMSALWEAIPELLTKRSEKRVVNLSWLEPANVLQDFF